MTQSKIERKRKNDLSHIDTLADLQAEMRMVKARLKNREEELAAQWKKLPAESFKLVVRKVVPFYLNNKVLDKSWGLIAGLTGLVGKGDKGQAKKNVVGTAKKLGLFTAVRALFNVWRKK